MAAKSRISFLSSSTLKIIAMVAMVIDHYSVIFYGQETTILRHIGRISFPIFAFLIAEGAKRSKNKLKYAVRLLVFAFISEIPYDWGFYGEVLYIEKQNVFFTLFLGLVSVITYDMLQKRKLGLLAFITTAVFGLAAALLESDYGFMGVVVITLMGVFHSTKAGSRYLGFTLASFLTCIAYIPPVGVYFIPPQIYATLAAVPISLYNGKKGIKINKYFFYIFYPMHILILWTVKLFINSSI